MIVPDAGRNADTLGMAAIAICMVAGCTHAKSKGARKVLFLVAI